jgi:hypothetical protein
MTAPATEVAARLSTAVRRSVIIVLAGGAFSVPVVASTGGLVFALSVPMRRLAVPRRSDFASYWRVAQSLLVRPGSAARW